MNLFFETPANRMFRKMGYFGDQSGIIRRYRREQAHWDTHLQHTRQFAIDAMQGKNRRSAAVLGSGWLLDVPLEELSRTFGKVCLFDIRHPKAVKEQVRNMPGVELCTCDISCYARAVYQYACQYRNRKNRPPINSIQPLDGLNLNGFDFIFSCNILNQLDILLIDYLLQFFTLSAEETIAFRSNIQHHHIGLLPQNRSCLVADCEEITCTPDSVEISRKSSVYHPITRRPDAKRWIWEFDTCMTYYKDRKTSFNVLGVKI